MGCQRQVQQPEDESDDEDEYDKSSEESCCNKMRMSTTRVLRRAVATKLVVTVAICFIRPRTFGLC